MAVRQVGLSLAGPGGPGSLALGPGWEGPQLHAPVDPQPRPALPPTSRGFRTGAGSPQPLILPNGLQRPLQTELLGGPPLRRAHHPSGTPLGGLRSLHVASAAPGPWTPQLLLCGMGPCTRAMPRAPSQGLGMPRWGVPISCVCEWPRAAWPPPTHTLSLPLSLSLPLALSSPFRPCRSALCSVGA